MGSVSIMISALRFTSIKLEVYFSAMVAVSVASTLAFTPLPRPSESTEMVRFSSLNFRERNTSPETNWPFLALWQ